MARTDSKRTAQAKARATRERKAAGGAITDVDPVARVLLDLPLAHLDRPFDFAVPAAMAEAARPGVRVKVRFAGQDADVAGHFGRRCRSRGNRNDPDAGLVTDARADPLCRGGARRRGQSFGAFGPGIRIFRSPLVPREQRRYTEPRLTARVAAL